MKAMLSNTPQVPKRQGVKAFLFLSTPEHMDGGCAPAQAERHVGGHGGHHDLVVGVLEDEAGRAVRARQVPALGASWPPSARSSVDLPQPLGPSSMCRRPRGTGQARAAQHLPSAGRCWRSTDDNIIRR